MSHTVYFLDNGSFINEGDEREVHNNLEELNENTVNLAIIPPLKILENAYSIFIQKG